jgi:Rho GTPase-activating protein 1
MQRMPSFEKFNTEQQGSSEDTHSGTRTLRPKKINLKKQSVEDLRKLYEERAGTASVLVEAGKKKQG